MQEDEALKIALKHWRKGGYIDLNMNSEARVAIGKVIEMAYKYADIDMPKPTKYAPEHPMGEIVPNMWFVFPRRIEDVKYHTLLIEASCEQVAKEIAIDARVNLMTMETEYLDVAKPIRTGYTINPVDVLRK